MLRNA
jgi:anti-sigma-K factor RskA